MSAVVIELTRAVASLIRPSTDTWKWMRKQGSVLLIYFAGGIVAYQYLEGWHWLDSTYFMVVTSTTVGYGDFSQTTEISRLFTSM